MASKLALHRLLDLRCGDAAIAVDVVPRVVGNTARACAGGLLGIGFRNVLRSEAISVAVVLLEEIQVHLYEP